jgi:hypothetical protein
MPRKAGYRHHEDTRKRIQAQSIINRLQAHIDSPTPIMDASQVNAARALLNKVLPDLSAVQVGGDQDNPIEHKIEITIVDPSAGSEEA